jgi:TatD DNase family protein
VNDSHTHLDVCEPPNEELVAQARALGVTRMLTVGMDALTGRGALEAARSNPGVFAAIGHHPNNAEGFGPAELAALEELAGDEHCLAIGETGLDFFRKGAPRADQERAFRAQIELARAVAKPLVIHTRAAEDDTIAILRECAAGVQVVLHCFSMPDRLDECLAEGWWISFAGNVSYPANAALADAVERVPDNRLLVETDAPYLTPQPIRRERNRPAHVVYTAEFVAERRGQPYQELEAIVDRNAAALLGW